MIAIRALVAFTAALLAGKAYAAPLSIADCEAIEAADAYNRCLASFGPVRGGGGGKYYGPVSEPAHGAARHSHRSSSAAGQRSHSGRMRMEFTPGH
jgi:hypothetical protein